VKEYIAVLFTHSDAIKLSRECKKREINHKLMPVPRKLSSNCGVCVDFHSEEDIQDLIFSGVEKVFSVENGNYVLVYE